MAPSTRAMADRLSQIADSVPLREDLYDSTRVAAQLETMLQAAPDGPHRRNITYQLAVHTLNAGNPKEAVQLVELLLAELARTGSKTSDELHYNVLDLLALSHLRRGETDNCIAHHGIDSCLMPIQGGGVHTAQSGSRAAIEVYERMLETRPSDLTSRWLLNVAYMTVGDYPHGVPSHLLIPPRLFESDYDIERFRDIAAKAGVSIAGLSGGSIMEDFDGDGLLDLMTSSWGRRDPMYLFLNDGDGTFTDFTANAGLSGLGGGLNLIPADYDNDGDVDVLVTRGAWRRTAGDIPNSLLRNNGDGTFDDVTEAAGLLAFHPTQAACWADFDGDGFLDLFIGNESDQKTPHASELHHNDADGTFTDRAALLGEPHLGFVKGAACGDYNNDGRPDLFVSVMGGRNLLFRNDGPVDDKPMSFSEHGAEAGVSGPSFGFSAWFWDYDNDGHLDLFVAGFRIGNPGETAALYLGEPIESEVPRLYRNRGDQTFEDVSTKMKVDRVPLVMGANFGDLDNDGWLDCYLGTGEPDFRALVPNRMLRNDRGRMFQDVTTSGGFGHLQKGHGIAFGDIDNDGDQDIYQDIGGAMTGDIGHNALFENPGHGNHWTTLRLEGRRSNRRAVGARVRVRVATPGGSRDIYATVGTGGSFGASSLQQEIGLGDATRIRQIEIGWPTTGQIQTFDDLEVDRVYGIVEGRSSVETIEVTRFRLGGG